jgi:aminomethyltransferase
LRRKEASPQRRLVGFVLEDKGIPRQGFSILDPAGFERVGVVTSGTLSPSTGQSIGIGYVPQHLSTVGSWICVDLRGRPAKARVVETPFLRTSLSS